MRRPSEGLGSGKLAGWARRSRTSSRVTSAQLASRPTSSPASAAAWLRASATAATRAASSYQHHGDHAVEAPGLGVRPGVDRAHDLAAVVGVGAALLERAAIADVRSCAVAHESSLVVEFVGPEVLALGADPDVMVGVVVESGGAVAQRAPVGVCRQPLQHAGRDEQGERVARREQGLRAHLTLAAAASSELTPPHGSGSSISVNRMSSGSSRVTRLTVWRIPMYAM